MIKSTCSFIRRPPQKPFEPSFVTKHAVHCFGNETSVMRAKIFVGAKKSIKNAVGRVVTAKNKVIRFDCMADKRRFFHRLHIDNFRIHFRCAVGARHTRRVIDGRWDPILIEYNDSSEPVSFPLQSLNRPPGRAQRLAAVILH